MHYHAEVLIPTDENVEEQVADVMAPFKESDNNGFWDWYLIGSRWKGYHVSDYDPHKDPKHLETCSLCNGTGDRPGWVSYKVTQGEDTLAEVDSKRTATVFVQIRATRLDLSYDEFKVIRQFKDSWAEKCNGCNGCDGKGISVSWPTQWGSHPKDVIHVSQMSPELDCRTLIVNGHAQHTEIWTGREWVKTDFDGNVAKMLDKLGVADGFLVTVDYHC